MLPTAWMWYTVIIFFIGTVILVSSYFSDFIGYVVYFIV